MQEILHLWLVSVSHVRYLNSSQMEVFREKQVVGPKWRGDGKTCNIQYDTMIGPLLL